MYEKRLNLNYNSIIIQKIKKQRSHIIFQLIVSLLHWTKNLVALIGNFIDSDR